MPKIRETSPITKPPSATKGCLDNHSSVEPESFSDMDILQVSNSTPCQMKRKTCHQSTTQRLKSASLCHYQLLLTITATQYIPATSAPATSPMDCSGFFSISNLRLNQSKPRSNRWAAFKRSAET